MWCAVMPVIGLFFAIGRYEGEFEGGLRHGEGIETTQGRPFAVVYILGTRVHVAPAQSARPAAVRDTSSESIANSSGAQAAPGDKLEAKLRALTRRIMGPASTSGRPVAQAAGPGAVADARVEAVRELGRLLGEDAGEDACRQARRAAPSAGVVAALVGLMSDDERLETQVRRALTGKRATECATSLHRMGAGKGHTDDTA
jgi:hypothetical protein